ncbi:PepSY domain-containing protein [Tropicimonas sp. IMCC34043]|uniref:PepSY domain-containing protein n=1 Tax=Tropicimonas sp. IMCC34043 TaxID=2248760 RepID=UPI000E23CBB2|nr:PepSY domain-containing protein [Tropicimonas sp. IMCC34043]
MKMTLTILGFLALLPVLLPVAAAARHDDCFVPMADWQPREAVAQLAEDNGWVVRRIKIDDGCYQIDGTDADGRRIEVTVHPSTLQVIEVEYEGERNRHRGNREEWKNDD